MPSQRHCSPYICPANLGSLRPGLIACPSMAEAAVPILCPFVPEERPLVMPLLLRLPAPLLFSLAYICSRHFLCSACITTQRIRKGPCQPVERCDALDITLSQGEGSRSVWVAWWIAMASAIVAS